MIIEVNKLSSTNEHMNRLIDQGDLAEGTIVITQNQTSGKGQQGNSWISKPHKNLTFSLLLKPHIVAPENMFMISKAVSIGIIKYLNSLGKTFTIKWPNDIYYKEKKICGILVENKLMGAQISNSVIGIGLNINQDKWPDFLPNPISLRNIFNKDFDLNSCLQELTSSINEWYKKLLNNEVVLIQDEYFKNLYRNTGYSNYKANENIFEARIDSVSSDGMLTLITKGGEKKYFYFKEVEFTNS